MAGIKSGTLVAGLVTTALTTVCVLTVQAAGSPADPAARARAARPVPRSAGGDADAAELRAVRLPAGSGAGPRVVYSPAKRRVWLVGEDELVLRTFAVVPGNVAPPLGSHKVFARRAGGEGGDGRPVEHVVLFAAADGLNVGFSAAADDSLAPPEPARRSAAVRERRVDAAALWGRAAIGSTVEVVR